MAVDAQNAVSISIEDYNKLTDAWALPIGRFLVAFTSCEYWTYLYIQAFGSERLREAVSDSSLKSRAKLAHSLVSDLDLTRALLRGTRSKSGSRRREAPAFARGNIHETY